MKQGEIIYKMVKQYSSLRIVKYKVLSSNDNNTVIELASSIMPNAIFKDYEIISNLDICKELDKTMALYLLNQMKDTADPNDTGLQCVYTKALTFNIEETIELCRK